MYSGSIASVSHSGTSRTSAWRSVIESRANANSSNMAMPCAAIKASTIEATKLTLKPPGSVTSTDASW
nr:hypothetical protein [Vibrio coralliilyticus]